MPTAETDAQPGRTTKVCSGCGVSKPATTEFFHYDERYRMNLRSECKECRAIRSRFDTIKRKYGLSREEYTDLLESQGGVCAICAKGPTVYDYLSVDHNHDTGEVRGLLCHPCNAGIGKLGDSIQRLRAAISYLEGADG